MGGDAAHMIIISRAAPKIKDPLKTLSFIQIALGLSVFAISFAFNRLWQLVDLFAHVFHDVLHQYLQLEFIISFMLLCIPTVCMGACFPLVNMIAARKQQTLPKQWGHQVFMIQSARY